jgi:hypothetical protein
VDDNYQAYFNRVTRTVLRETYRFAAHHMQESYKFGPQPNGDRTAVPFPGYTTITPPGEDESRNVDFYQNLLQYQQQLVQRIDKLMVPLPPESFHLTVADLIWDDAYRHASSKPDFDQQLTRAIEQIFRQSESIVSGVNPIRWQMLGLMVMPRAVAICLVPTDEQSYDRIVKLRRAIYQNPDLIALGIEQQYGFTAHITLGYFGEIPADLERDRLGDTFFEFNQEWLDKPFEFLVHRAELRKFDDMTRYYRQPDWPVLEF